MPPSILRDAAGRAQVVRNADGNPWLAVGIDPTAADVLALITFGFQRTDGGLPVFVTLPPGYTGAEVLAEFGRPAVTLPAGASIIYQPDLVEAQTLLPSVDVIIRAVNASGKAKFGWRRLIWRAAPNVVPPRPADPLTFDEAPTLRTSGVEGEAISYEWASPSIAGVTVERLIRVYNGTTLVNTLAAPTVVPDVSPYSIVPFQRAMDPATGLWVTIEGETKTTIQNAVVSGVALTQGDFTFTSTWKTPGLRQQVRTSFVVAGMARTALLEWRINTERYQTDWASCPVRDAAPAVTTDRVLGTILRPAGQPGEGYPLEEFIPLEEDMRALEFRWRTSTAVNWSPISPKIVVPMPATGAMEFNSTPTTLALLRTAITNGFAATGLYIVGIPAGTYALASNALTQLHFEALSKTGLPLFITSTTTASPANFNGYQGRLWRFERCSNFVLMGIRCHNNQTADIGSSVATPVVPPRSFPTGNSFTAEGCRRFQVKDIWFQDHDVAVELRDCDYAYLGFLRITGTVQDGIRLFWRGSNILVEGEWQEAPNVYGALSKANRYENGINYHPDAFQVSVTNRRVSGYNVERKGGIRNFRRVRGYAVGYGEGRYTAGYYGNEMLRGGTYATTSQTWADNISLNWTFREMYIENGYNNAAVFECVDGFLWKDCVVRRSAIWEREISLFTPQVWIKNVRIENTVCWLNYFIHSTASQTDGDTWAQTEIDRRAAVTGAVTTAKNYTTWPTGWTGGADRFPRGPFAWGPNLP